LTGFPLDAALKHERSFLPSFPPSFLSLFVFCRGKVWMTLDESAIVHITGTCALMHEILLLLILMIHDLWWEYIRN
jgi:hypothetical protein